MNRPACTAAAALIGLALAGCLRITPADGLLQCSTIGRQCPTDYYCAGDNTCWHNGKGPTTGGDDMSVGDAGSVDSPDLAPQLMSCMLPSDCPMPTQGCLLPACIQGVCGLVAAPAGTTPAQIQVKGTCQKLVCDSSGNAAPMTDTTNVPADATGGCNTPSCTGPTPKMTPTAAGTTCSATTNGVCNGAGICGVCKPGAAQCKGLTIQSCSTSGQWVDGTVCKNACTGGMCTGMCTSGVDAPYCTGIDQLNSCGADHAWHATTCPNACSSGACSGSCKPSAKTCSGSTVVWCDATGTPQSMACSACLNGACVDCNPSATQCCSAGALAGHQSCDSGGHWGTCSACGGNADYSCAGAGTCSCSAPSPCKANDACGTRSDGCGVVQGCGPNGDGSCNVGYCSYNTTTQTYVCKSTTSTTGGCPCGPGNCCGKLCC